jgi:hypothetical protein
MKMKDVLQVALAIAAIFIGIDLTKFALSKMKKTTTA